MRIALSGDRGLQFEPEWPALVPRAAESADAAVAAFVASEAQHKQDDTNQHRRGDRS
jgi:hypothetical protein